MSGVQRRNSHLGGYTVYPDCWVQNGGKASIKFFSGNLIITASRSVHEAIGGIAD